MSSAGLDVHAANHSSSLIIQEHTSVITHTCTKCSKFTEYPFADKLAGRFKIPIRIKMKG